MEGGSLGYTGMSSPQPVNLLMSACQHPQVCATTRLLVVRSAYTRSIQVPSGGAPPGTKTHLQQEQFSEKAATHRVSNMESGSRTGSLGKGIHPPGSLGWLQKKHGVPILFLNHQRDKVFDFKLGSPERMTVAILGLYYGKADA